MLKRFKWMGIVVLAAFFLVAAVTAGSATELAMYYPVAVGGPLTKIVDCMVADFMKSNPDIDVQAIYAGNYNDARIKALTALKIGEPAQLSVMFSIDIYDLIEQDAIVAFEDLLTTDEDSAWLDSFYPALMENGKTLGKTWGFPSSAPPSSCTTTRTCSVKPALTPKSLRQPGKNWWRPAKSSPPPNAPGADDPIHGLPLLDVRGPGQAKR